MQKITPFLWLNGNAEEAANFYVSIFKNAKVGRVTKCGDAGKIDINGLKQAYEQG